MGICESNKNTKSISPVIIHSEKKEEIEGEIVFPGIGSHIPQKKLKIISNQKEKSICKIEINKGPKGTGFGTGFLCNIGEYKKIKSLVTAYHVLGEKQLQKGNEINITFNDDKKSKIIKLDGSRRIYANEKDDITIIEIKDSDRLNNYEALEIDSNIYNNNNNFYDKYNNKVIYIYYIIQKVIL